MTTIYKGDDTGAFGNTFITLKVKNPELLAISKLVLSINGGCITKTFTDAHNFQAEEIVLRINFSSAETAKLNVSNTVNLIAYDEQGKQSTCRQSVSFSAKNGVITKNA